MSWLKKVGKVALEAGKVAVPLFVPGGAQIMAVAERMAPRGELVATPAGDFSQLAQIALTAEVMGQAVGLAGAEKLKMAAPFVGPLILASPFMRGKTIEDPALFMRGCEQIIAGTADALNSLDDKDA